MQAAAAYMKGFYGKVLEGNEVIQKGAISCIIEAVLTRCLLLVTRMASTTAHLCIVFD